MVDKVDRAIVVVEGGGTPTKMAGHNRQPIQGDSPPPQYPESFLQVREVEILLGWFVWGRGLTSYLPSSPSVW